MGYNLLEANPEGDFNRGGVDPGIKTTRFIFHQTFSTSQANNIYYRGKKMAVPDQVTFHQSQSCALSTSTHAYSGQSSYKKELALNVHAQGNQFSLYVMYNTFMHVLLMQVHTMDCYSRQALH